LFAAFIPGHIVGEMTSIGTLLAFILVCAGVLIMRYKMPDAPRGFRTPFVPFVPIMGILTCLGMMVFLPLDTWIRLIIWMAIGFVIFFLYSLKNLRKAGNSF
jgi:APA family basic amino acid/polyamine antiporter